mmetsp:Transcript_10957/g.25680  ORF Transcript_10957/g.25680 Transcript_10957/m.25680 type:complete len:223 (-) Transcript_10957:86-754(-)
MRRFVEAYNERGFDTYAFSAGPREVLFPDKAVLLMEANLDAVTAQLKGTEDRPIIFHGFSMSGFLWGNALGSMDREPERFAHFKQNLRAQIFDSPPDLNGIAGGVARSMGYGGIREIAIKSAMSFYLEATKDGAGVVHRASSKRFHANGLAQVPSLWLYSKSDPVARWEDCREVCSKWRAQGVDVDETVFEDTPHVQHLLREPERYLGALDSFLGKHGLLEK